MTDQAEWWCAFCPTSHPTSGAMAKHMAAEHPDQLSTSAQLQQTQQALAASQADLTRVEAERTELRGRLVSAWAERDITRAELASARTELEQLRRAIQASPPDPGAGPREEHP